MIKSKYSNFGNASNVINNFEGISMGVGMPTQLLLNEFGSRIIDAFDEIPFHVGSSLWNKIGWRDVDVRLILDDEQYENMGFGDPRRCHQNEKWIAMCLAFSLLGKYMTGLPVDFQIQQMTHANENFKGKRSALGMVPHRMKK